MGTADEKPLDFTVVIPAFNEEEAIVAEVEGIHRALRETGHRYEVIVVDDGSSDRTAERAATTECRLIRLDRNHGYGAALKRGFAEARTEAVVITDADGTYSAEEIPRLLEAFPDRDMVVGARTGERVHDSHFRRPARFLLRVIAGYLAGRNIPDLNSGLRVIRRSLVRRFARVLPSGFSFTTTITLALLCNDYDVEYVPINYEKRVGTSKIRPIDTYHFFLLILRAIVLFNPLKVFLPLGAVAFLAGAAKFVYDVTQNNLSESAVMGLLGAIVIWAVGLLADQNSRLGLDRWSDRDPLGW